MNLPLTMKKPHDRITKSETIHAVYLGSKCKYNSVKCKKKRKTTKKGDLERLKRVYIYIDR